MIIKTNQGLLHFARPSVGRIAAEKITQLEQFCRLVRHLQARRTTDDKSPHMLPRCTRAA